MTRFRFNFDPTIFKFAVVGVSSTLADFVLFTVLFHIGVMIIAANIISYVTSLLLNFGLNSIWTFKNTANPAPIITRATRYAVVHSISLTLSTILVLAFDLFAPTEIAKAASIPIIFFWNYFAVKTWVFNNPND